jgi:multidrug efflux pump subunit AcrB
VAPIDGEDAHCGAVAASARLQRRPAVQMVLRSPDDFKTLYETAEKIKAAAYASGLFLYVQNDLAYDSLHAHMTIDNAKAGEMGVTMQAIAIRWRCWSARITSTASTSMTVPTT